MFLYFEYSFLFFIVILFSFNKKILEFLKGLVLNIMVFKLAKKLRYFNKIK